MRVIDDDASNNVSTWEFVDREFPELAVLFSV